MRSLLLGIAVVAVLAAPASLAREPFILGFPSCETWQGGWLQVAFRHDQGGNIERNERGQIRFWLALTDGHF